MTRKFLADLGINKESIHKIMAINGADIEKAKRESKAILVEFEATKRHLLEAKQKLVDMHFNSIIETAIHNVKGKDVRAVKALLELESLKASENLEEAINVELGSLKKEKAFLFELDENVPIFVKGTNER